MFGSKREGHWGLVLYTVRLMFFVKMVCAVLVVVVAKVGIFKSRSS